MGIGSVGMVAEGSGGDVSGELGQKTTACDVRCW